MRTFSQLSASIFAVVVLVLGGCSSAPTEQEEKKELVYPAPPDQPRFYFERTVMSNYDVEYETEESSFQRFLTGVSRTGSGMVKPYDIATHKGRIFVSDPPGRAVHMFDFRQFKYKKIGEDAVAANIMRKPFGIDVDDQGNLYVIDQTAGNIKIYNRDGDFLRKFGDHKMFSMPSGLAVTGDGARLYIADTGGVSSKQHHILEFDAHSGEILQTIGTRGSGELEFNLPKDIALDDNNHLYVVDSGNFRVQIIDLKDNSLVRIFGEIGRSMGQFSRPKGIALDKDGNIYVSDAAFGNFQIFNSQGQLLMFIGDRSTANEPGKYLLNSGIAVDEDGRVLMADQYHRKFDIFRPAAIAEDEGYLGKIKDLTDEKYNALKAKLDAEEKGEVLDPEVKGELKEQAVENKQ